MRAQGPARGRTDAERSEQCDLPAYPHALQRGVGIWEGVDIERLIPGRKVKLPDRGLTAIGNRLPFATTDAPEIAVRALDFTVVPGLHYRYRVRIVIDGSDGVGQRREVFGPWSEATPEVAVTSQNQPINPKEQEVKQIPSGTELARPFLPARDFDLSKSFYETLGFEKLLDGDVAIFGAGSGGFILQRYYQKDWAENFMMQLMVDDLDAWWTHIQNLDLPGKFNVQPPRAPAMQPWGLRIAYVFDPSGVLWHIGERRDGTRHD